MSIEIVNKLLQQKEGIRLEFKEAKQALPSNLFETICAMLNREGGDILLGVEDNGAVVGVEKAKADALRSDLVNLSNNPQKLDPPFILFPAIYELEDKLVIHLQIPVSSQVHKTGNFVFDRSNDGDFKITQPGRIAELYNRKKTHYTEGTIYPFLLPEDLDSDTLQKARSLIKSNNPNHPWLNLTDETLLQTAGLWRRDLQTGHEGYTLAAALLFGKEETITNILPHYKTDALVRINNPDRYDDRDYIQCNLINAYERLMDFITRHLPDKFYLEGDQRINLRSNIFREIIANILVHREFTDAYPATLTIFADRVETVNANIPNGQGPILPDKFAPYPKNPTIAKFFIQLGRVDELGSGILNVNKYLSAYSPGSKADFIEGAVFKTVIPTSATVNATVNATNDTINATVKAVNATVSDTLTATVKEYLGKQTSTVKERFIKIVELIYHTPGLRSNMIAAQLILQEQPVRRDLQKLQSLNLVEFKGSPKTGGYFVTEQLNKSLNKMQ